MRPARLTLAATYVVALAALVGSLGVRPSPLDPRAYLQERGAARRADGWRDLERAHARPDAFRGRLRELLGWPADRPAIESRVVRRLEVGGVDVEAVLFESEPHSSVPAIVLRARGGPARRPAVVHLHQFNSNLSLGKSKDFDVLLRLARAGFIVMSADAMGFEDRRGGAVIERDRDFPAAGRLALLGRPLFGTWLFDQSRAIDYLVARADVDPRQIAAVGLSKGGWEAIWLAALDPRLVAAMSVAGANNHLALLQSGRQTVANVVPDIIYAETLLPALVTPRALRVQVGGRDGAVPAGAAAALYGRRHAWEGFEFAITPDAHEWGDIPAIVSWLQRRTGAADIRPAPSAAVEGGWLPVARIDSRRVATVPQRTAVYPWVRVCDAAAERAMTLAVDGATAGAASTIYNEARYLRRIAPLGVWQWTRALTLEAGRHAFDVSAVPSCAADVRLAASESAAPDGALKLNIAAWLDDEEREALTPASLVRHLARPSGRTGSAAMREWLSRELAPLAVASQARPATLPDDGRVLVRLARGLQALATVRPGSGDTTAMIVGRPESLGELDEIARRRGWRRIELELRGSRLPAAALDLASRAAIQAGEPLLLGAAADLATLARALAVASQPVAIVADRSLAPAALAAAAVEPAIARVVIPSPALRPLAGRAAGDGASSFFDVLPGFVQAGDLPELAALVGARLEAISVPAPTAPQ